QVLERAWPRVVRIHREPFPGDPAQLDPAAGALDLPGDGDGADDVAAAADADYERTALAPPELIGQVAGTAPAQPSAGALRERRLGLLLGLAGLAGLANRRGRPLELFVRHHRDALERQ